MRNDNGNALDRRRLIGGGIGLAAAPMTPAFAAPAATRIAGTMLHGRQALAMNNGLLSLAVLPGGGFIGDVRLVSRDPRLDISPMLRNLFGTEFRQTGLIVKGGITSTTALDSVSRSATGMTGSFMTCAQTYVTGSFNINDSV